MAFTSTRRRILSVFIATVLMSGTAMARTFTSRVEISAADIDWLRDATVFWDNVESGAPGIIPKGVPEDDARSAIDEDEDIPGAGERLERVLCAFFLNAAFGPGHYRFKRPLAGISDFTVTDEHIRLLRAASWRKSVIDGKRPYGDFTYYQADMARALGVSVGVTGDGAASVAPDVEKRLEALHHEMLFVMQAYLEHARITPGRLIVPYEGWSGVVLRCRPLDENAADAYETLIGKIDRMKRAGKDADTLQAQASRLLSE